MATVKEIRRKSGKSAFQIVYTDSTGKRVYLSLGSSYTRKEAEEASFVVERLLICQTTGAPLDKRTLGWIEGSSEDLRERLERAGLIELEKELTLLEVWDEYWEAEFYELKPTTQSSKTSARKHFFRYFDEETKVAELTKRDALGFVSNLDMQVKEATRAGVIRDVRRVFNWAKEAELIEKNPFDGIRRGSFKNKTREYYVPIEDYEKLLDACPSQMWRAVLALYRIGGLRKEEALRATWSDVDFARGRLLVHSPKTERYKGRESRVLPLFPRLREELERLWEEAEEGGSPYLIDANRTSITQHVEKIVFLAGLNRWERLIQNLRSSRAIEVFNEFGELAESEWIGHSPKTAREHYLHVLDETFERAVGTEMGSSPNWDKNDPKNDPTRRCKRPQKASNRKN